MSTVCVLAAASATITTDRRGGPKPPDHSLALAVTSTVLESIPVVLVSADSLGADEAWVPGEAVSYPLSVVAFPWRDLAQGLAMHVSLVGPADWSGFTRLVELNLELVFAQPGADPVRWSPPPTTVDTAVGSSQRFTLPALSLGRIG